MSKLRAGAGSRGGARGGVEHTALLAPPSESSSFGTRVRTLGSLRENYKNQVRAGGRVCVGLDQFVLFAFIGACCQVCAGQLLCNPTPEGGGL